jgi:serine/threonine protein kinase
MNGIEVAVKFPKIKLTLRGKDLKKFEKEVAIQAKVRYAFPFQSTNCHTFASQFREHQSNTLPLCQVRHPHCVQIIAASLDPSDPFIVMEWVSGGNWFHRLGCDPPPPAHQRITAVREISSAMQYLHDPMIGIIHGDIKGLNMLLMRDGSSKVKHAFVFVWYNCVLFHDSAAVLRFWRSSAGADDRCFRLVRQQRSSVHHACILRARTLPGQ